MKTDVHCSFHLYLCNISERKLKKIDERKAKSEKRKQVHNESSLTFENCGYG